MCDAQRYVLRAIRAINERSHPRPRRLPPHDWLVLLSSGSAVADGVSVDGLEAVDARRAVRTSWRRLALSMPGGYGRCWSLFWTGRAAAVVRVRSTVTGGRGCGEAQDLSKVMRVA
eukprot:6836040-Prymnesium_polylepis.1